jgi:subtilase family serine protease
MLRVLCLTVLLAVASARLMKVFESAESAPKGWTFVGKTSENFEVDFTVALTQNNMDALETELLKVSNPKDAANYGKWWSIERIRDFVAPSKKEQNAVRTWLEAFGMKVRLSSFYFSFVVISFLLEITLLSSIQVETFGSFQKVTGSSKAVEKMLGTSFYTFEKEGKTINRLIEYNIPDRLDGVVTMISGLTGFPVQRRSGRSRVATDDSKGKVIKYLLPRYSMYDSWLIY